MPPRPNSPRIRYGPIRSGRALSTGCGFGEVAPRREIQRGIALPGALQKAGQLRREPRLAVRELDEQRSPVALVELERPSKKIGQSFAHRQVPAGVSSALSQARANCQSRLTVAERDGEAMGDLLDLEIGEVAQLDHATLARVARGELGQRAVEVDEVYSRGRLVQSAKSRPQSRRTRASCACAPSARGRSRPGYGASSRQQVRRNARGPASRRRAAARDPSLRGARRSRA